MEFLIFIFVVILFFWVYSLQTKLDNAQREIAQLKNSLPQSGMKLCENAHQTSHQEHHLSSSQTQHQSFTEPQAKAAESKLPEYLWQDTETQKLSSSVAQEDFLVSPKYQTIATAQASDNSYSVHYKEHHQVDHNNVGTRHKKAETENVYTHDNSLTEDQVQKKSSKHSHEEKELEANFAANWLNKIGVIAILFGMGFFFWYIYPYISDIVKILIGLIVGGLFIFLGWLWREKYPKYADAIIGGGLAIWYFTVFAAYNFYSLMPQSLAIIFMAIVSAFGVWMAKIRQSQALLALACIGAYGAPIFLYSAQESNQFLVFCYLSVLNLSVIAALYKSLWLKLLNFAFWATLVNIVFWLSIFKTPENTIFSANFIALNFTIFIFGLQLINHWYKNIILHNSSNATILNFINFCNALSLFAMEVMLLVVDYKNWLQIILLFCTFVVFIAYGIGTKNENKFSNLLLSGIGFAFVSYVFYLHFHGKALILSYMLLANAGVFAGLIVKRFELRIWSICLLILSIFQLLFLDKHTIDQLFLLNYRFALFILAVLTAAIASLSYYLLEAGEEEKGMQGILAGASVLLLWGGVTLDIINYFSFPIQNYYLAFWWLTYSLLTSVFAKIVKAPWLFILSLLLGTFSLVNIFILPSLSEQHFILNSKFTLMILQTATIFYFGYIAESFKDSKFLVGAKNSLWIFATILLWIFGSKEIISFYNYSENVGKYALGLWWIVYPCVVAMFGYVFKKGWPIVLALLLAAISLVNAIAIPYEAGARFIFNMKFGLMFLQMLAIYILGFFAEKNQDFTFLRQAGKAIIFILAVLVWGAVSFDIYKIFYGLGYTFYSTLNFWWIIYPIFLAFLAIKAKRAFLAGLALLFLLVSFISVLFMNYNLSYYFLFNAKFELMLLEVIALIVIGKAILIAEAPIGQAVQVTKFLKVIASLLLWYAFTVELWKNFRDQDNLKNLITSLWWIIYAAILVAYGIVRKSSIFRKVAMALFALSIVKVFIYDIQTLVLAYKIVAFIVLGIILLSVSFAYQKNKNKILKFLEAEKTN